MEKTVSTSLKKHYQFFKDKQLIKNRFISSTCITSIQKISKNTMIILKILIKNPKNLGIQISLYPLVLN